VLIVGPYLEEEMTVTKQIDIAETHNSSMSIISESDEPVVFTDIYQDLCNMTIWRRKLSPDFLYAVNDFLLSNNNFQFDKPVTPQNVLSEMYLALRGSSCMLALSEDIANLLDMFCRLFDLKQAGLRLTVLDRRMCPRFHVDKVPCRLITTYMGSATQWLHNDTVDRTKLGTGNNGLPDELSGIYKSVKDIQQLNNCDVAIMKGELWNRNENAGLVHRSPSVKVGEKRLLLTLDFIE